MERQKKYSISEFSEKTNISIRTLHYYDEIDLLVPFKNPHTGHRLYDDNDMLKLQKIVSLKFLGCSLQQIKSMLCEPNFDLGLKETLELQKAVFLKEKDRIKTALKAINRTITLLEDEGEVDSTILASLIHGMQTEKEQLTWLKQHVSGNVIDTLYGMPEEEFVALDKTFIQLCKKVKEMVEIPPNDPEVQSIIEEYMKTTLQFFGEDTLHQLAEINMEEAEQFARSVPSPFTKKEEEWLNQAMEYYMQQNGMISK